MKRWSQILAIFAFIAGLPPLTQSSGCSNPLLQRRGLFSTQEHLRIPEKSRAMQKRMSVLIAKWNSYPYSWKDFQVRLKALSHTSISSAGQDQSGKIGIATTLGLHGAQNTHTMSNTTSSGQHTMIPNPIKPWGRESSYTSCSEQGGIWIEVRPTDWYFLGKLGKARTSMLKIKIQDLGLAFGAWPNIASIHLFKIVF